MKSHWSNLIELPDDRAPWQWGDDFLGLKNSPFGKRFKSEHTPWIREPLEAVPDNNIKEDTSMGCVQGGKTMLLIVAASWAMRFQPAPMMINCQSDEDAKDFAKEKFNPAIETIPGLRERLPHDASKRSICSISLPDMFCLIQGANLNNLQSKSIRWEFNDELFLWKNGLLDHARKRTTQFWNRKIINVSTAGDVASDLDRAFNAGDKREYNIYCFKCSTLFQPAWSVIKWPKQDDWDFTLLKKSAYLECPHCKHQYEHAEENRKLMLSQARYVATNPRYTPGHTSHRWNAIVLSPEVLSWGDLAVEWVKAEIEFQKGNDAPRKEFITKRLAESYDPNRFMVETKLPTIEITSDWPEEAFRFLTVDVQELEFWAVVRAWARDGCSRLLWTGRLFTYDEIEAKANEFKVPSGCVFLDSSWDTRKVYLECAKRNEIVTMGNGRQDWMGWKALNGEAEARKNFVYKPAKGKPVMLPYSYPAKYVDPMSGRAAHERRYAKLYFWSNIAIKDILKRLRDGKGAPWLSYEGAPKDWQEHMFSERRVATWDNWNKESYKWERIGKRANHLWDCECMQVVAACIAGVIGDSLPQAAEQPA